MEKREANYLVRTVHRAGPGKQKLKQIERAASTIEEAQAMACALSKRYLYASTMVFDVASKIPVEFWNNGKKASR